MACPPEKRRTRTEYLPLGNSPAASAALISLRKRVAISVTSMLGSYLLPVLFMSTTLLEPDDAVKRQGAQRISAAQVPPVRTT